MQYNSCLHLRESADSEDFAESLGSIRTRILGLQQMSVVEPDSNKRTLITFLLCTKRLKSVLETSSIYSKQ